MKAGSLVALALAVTAAAASEHARPTLAVLATAADKVGNRRVDCPAQLVAGLDAREAVCVATELTEKQVRKRLRSVLRGGDVVPLYEFDWIRVGPLVEKRVFADREMFVLRFDTESAMLALVPSHGCFPPAKLAGVASVADADVAPPVIAERATPEYPDAARETRQRAFAMTQVLVLPDGRSGTACTLYVAPDGYGFSAAARKTVARHTYTPATRGGEPVPYVLNVTVTWEP